MSGARTSTVGARSSHYATRRDLNMLTNSGSYLNYVIENSLDPSERFPALIEAILDPSEGAASTVRTLLRQQFSNPIDARNYFLLYEANCETRTLMERYPADVIYQLLHTLQVPYNTNHTNFNSAMISRIQNQLQANDRLGQDFTEAAALAWQMTKLQPTAAGEPCYQLLRDISLRMYQSGSLHTVSRAIEHVYLTPKGRRTLTAQVLGRLRQHMSLLGNAIDLAKRAVYHRYIHTPRNLFATYNRNVELAIGLEENGWQAAHGTLDRLLVGDTFVSDRRDLWTYGGLQDPEGMTSVFVNAAGEETIGAPDEPNNPTSGNTKSFGPVHANAANTAAHVAGTVPGVAMHGGGAHPGAPAPVVAGAPAAAPAAPAPAAPAAPPAPAGPPPKGGRRVKVHQHVWKAGAPAPAALGPAAGPAAHPPGGAPGAPVPAPLPPGGPPAPAPGPAPAPAPGPAPAPLVVAPGGYGTVRANAAAGTVARPGSPTHETIALRAADGTMTVRTNPKAASSLGKFASDSADTSMTVAPTMAFADESERRRFLRDHRRELNDLGAEANNTVYTEHPLNDNEILVHHTIGDALQSTVKGLLRAIASNNTNATALAVSRTDIARLTGEVTTLQNDLATVTAAHGAGSAQVTALQAQLATANNDLTNAQAAFNAEQAAHVNTRADLGTEQAAHTVTQGNLTAAQRDLGDEQAAHTVTQGNLTAAQRDLGDEQAAHTATQGNLTAAQRDLGNEQTAHRATQADLNAERSNHILTHQQLTIATSEINNLKTAISGLRNDLTAAHAGGGAQVKQLSDLNATLTTQLGAANAQSAAHATELAGAKLKMVQLAQDLADTTTELTSKDVAVTQTTKTLTDLRKKLSDMQTQHTTDLVTTQQSAAAVETRLHHEIQQRDVQLQKMEVAKAQYEKAIQDREAEIAQHRQDYEDAKTTYSTMQQKYRAERATLQGTVERLKDDNKRYMEQAEKTNADSVARAKAVMVTEQTHREHIDSLKAQHEHAQRRLERELTALKGQAGNDAVARSQQVSDMIKQKELDFQKATIEMQRLHTQQIADQQRSFQDTTQDLVEQLRVRKADLSQLQQQLLELSSENNNQSVMFADLHNDIRTREAMAAREKDALEKSLDERNKLHEKLKQEHAQTRQDLERAEKKAANGEALQKILQQNTAEHERRIREIEGRSAEENKKMRDQLTQAMQTAAVAQNEFEARLTAERRNTTTTQAEKQANIDALQAEHKRNLQQMRQDMQAKLDEQVQNLERKAVLDRAHAQSLQDRIDTIQGQLAMRNDESLRLTELNTTKELELAPLQHELQLKKLELEQIQQAVRTQTSTRAVHALDTIQELQVYVPDAATHMGSLVPDAADRDFLVKFYQNLKTHGVERTWQQLDMAQQDKVVSIEQALSRRILRPDNFKAILEHAQNQTQMEMTQHFANESQQFEGQMRAQQEAIQKSVRALVPFHHAMLAHAEALEDSNLDVTQKQAALSHAQALAAHHKMNAQQAMQALQSISGGSADGDTSAVLSRSIMPALQRSVNESQQTATASTDNVARNASALATSQSLHQSLMNATGPIVAGKVYDYDSGMDASRAQNISDMSLADLSSIQPRGRSSTASGLGNLSTIEDDDDDADDDDVLHDPLLAQRLAGIAAQLRKGSRKPPPSNQPEIESDNDTESPNTTVMDTTILQHQPAVSTDPGTQLALRHAAADDLTNAGDRTSANVLEALQTPRTARSASPDDDFGSATTPTAAVNTTTTSQTADDPVAAFFDMMNAPDYEDGDGHVSRILEAAASINHPTAAALDDDDFGAPQSANSSATSAHTSFSSLKSYSHDAFAKYIAEENPTASNAARTTRSNAGATTAADQRASLSNAYWNFVAFHHKAGSNIAETGYANDASRRMFSGPTGAALGALKSDAVGQTIRTLNPALASAGDDPLKSYVTAWNANPAPLRKAALTVANADLKRIGEYIKSDLPRHAGSQLVSMLTTTRNAPGDYRASGDKLGGPVGPITFKYLSALEALHAYTQHLKNKGAQNVNHGTVEVYRTMRSKIHQGLRNWLTLSNVNNPRSVFTPPSSAVSSPVRPPQPPAKPNKRGGKAS